MKRRKTRSFNLTLKYVILLGVLLFAANILLGMVIMRRSGDALRSLLNKNMLDITDTAAGFLDGDILGALTEEDVGSPAFEDIKNKLLVFQNHVDIEFIYAVKQVGEEEFVFTVDPDPVDPGEFGEEVLCTPALISAGKGVASVDMDPAADRWGNFYSAYSPVFDSKGNVAGIIGVDFDASEYEGQIRGYAVLIAIMIIVSCLIGGTVIVLMSARMRRGLKAMNQGLEELSDGVKQLLEEIGSNPGYSKEAGGSPADRSPDESGSGDEIAVLNAQIRSIGEEMKAYLAYMQEKANTDALTDVRNTTAYHERIDSIDGEAYSIALFDIDNLKKINDEYGHSAGDEIIKKSAAILADVFGSRNVYRIGGDEFIAIVEELPEEEMKKKLSAAADACEAYNRKSGEAYGRLSLSAGTAVCRIGSEQSFKEVFVRADESMYSEKELHHKAR